ncbi:MAG: carboxypeptidase regulatory-like domain-containing protein [Dehalococcoidia bacterium]|nr:carboxypeptidase regulatory-like domain-containing protein [Dehalococcoidia bacterium]
MKKREWRNRVIHFIVVLSLCLAIIAAPAVAIKADDSATYTACCCEDWLINQVESTRVPDITVPSVNLTAAHEMRIDDASMTILGASIALNHVVFAFNDTAPDTTVTVSGELSLILPIPDSEDLSLSPRFRLECTVSCEAGDAPQLSDINDINIAGESYSLSTSELDTIMDTINSAIDASGWTLGSSPDGNLMGIDVNSSGELVLSWDDGDPTSLDATAVTGKLQSAMDILVDEANNYLSTGYGDPNGKWWLRVAIVTDTMLTLNAQATVFGLTAKIEDMDITFPGCTAVNATGTVSLEGKQATFDATGSICGANYTPDLSLDTLGIDCEYSVINDLVKDNQADLCDALSTLATNVIEEIGLTCPVCFNNIGIEGDNLKVWLEGIPITGVTYEVNCEILPEVTVKLFDNGENLQDSTTSDVNGNYTVYAPEAGNYTVIASKTDFLDETQEPVEVKEGDDSVTLDFCGDHGLIPLVIRLPETSLDYFLLCMNLYLEDWGEYDIGLDKFLATMNAYLERW